MDLSSPTNATIGDGHGVGTIADDDPAPAISLSGGSVAEGDAGTATLSFTATLEAASGKQVTVGFATANGSATQPDDYTSTTGTLTFAPGQTTKRIDVPVVGDTRREGNETVAVDLSNPSNATLGTAHDSERSSTMTRSRRSRSPTPRSRKATPARQSFDSSRACRRRAGSPSR